MKYVRSAATMPNKFSETALQPINDERKHRSVKYPITNTYSNFKGHNSKHHSEFYQSIWIDRIVLKSNKSIKHTYFIVVYFLLK